MKSTLKHLLKSLKDNFKMMRIDKTLLKTIKLNLRLKFVKIGRNMENVNIKKLVLLHMAITNYNKKSIYLLISKQKYAHNSMKLAIVNMETDANSYTHNLIFIIKSIKIIIRYN